MCSSDRKRFIALHVKTMSFHHRAAGTRQWNSSESSSGCWSITRMESGSPQSRCLDSAVVMKHGADAERVPRAVGVPPMAAGLHPIGGGHGGERV